MTARLLAIASTIATHVLSASTPCAAQPKLIAGWDFSQYFGDGLLSIDGLTFTTTLDANYSDLDPTFGAGAESALFGTMYIDGSFGSTAVSADASGDEAILPTGGSLTSNLDVPLASFDAFTVLQDEGQASFNYLSMTAQTSASMVFKADAGTPQSGNWILSFAGKTFSGTSMVGVDFSTAGSGYGISGSVNLDTGDAQYIVDLGPATSTTAFVRLNFNPVGIDQPILDNVAISVPEPAALAQGLAVVAGLLFCARRRAV
jgi:hypothetical protein